MPVISVLHQVFFLTMVVAFSQKVSLKLIARIITIVTDRLCQFHTHLFQAPDKTETQPTLPELTLQISDNKGMQSMAQIVLHEDAQPGLDALDQRDPRDDFAPLSMGFGHRF